MGRKIREEREGGEGMCEKRQAHPLHPILWNAVRSGRNAHGAPMLVVLRQLEHQCVQARENPKHGPPGARLREKCIGFGLSFICSLRARTRTRVCALVCVSEYSSRRAGWVC